MGASNLLANGAPPVPGWVTLTRYAIVGLSVIILGLAAWSLAIFGQYASFYGASSGGMVIFTVLPPPPSPLPNPPQLTPLGNLDMAHLRRLHRRGALLPAPLLPPRLPDPLLLRRDLLALSLGVVCVARELLAVVYQLWGGVERDDAGGRGAGGVCWVGGCCLVSPSPLP